MDRFTEWTYKIFYPQSRSISKLIIGLHDVFSNIQQLFEALRIDHLGPDHCNLSRTLRRNFLFDTVQYSDDELIHMFYTRFVAFKIVRKDPGPCFYDAKWAILYQLLKLKLKRKEKGLEPPCVGVDLPAMLRDTAKEGYLISGGNVEGQLDAW